MIFLKIQRECLTKYDIMKSNKLEEKTSEQLKKSIKTIRGLQIIAGIATALYVIIIAYRIISGDAPDNMATGALPIIAMIFIVASTQKNQKDMQEELKRRGEE